MNKKTTISKERNAKHVKVLEGLLKLPENKECADCKNKAPRWASINLGIFICLQCSGIHRSLGVHISKVRSATLDIWLPEQVAFMQNMGNEKSNAYWEAELPLRYDRSRFDNFIRAKYVDRVWVPRESKVKSPPKSEERAPRESKGKSPPRPEEQDSPPPLCSTNQRIESNGGSLVEEQESSREEQASAQALKPRSNISVTDIAANQHLDRKDCLIDGKRDADHGKPEVHNKDTADDQTKEIVLDSGLKNNLQKTESIVLKDRSAAANAVPIITPPKVDYTTELFRMLWVDDSAESDSSPSSDMSTWVDFDTDEDETTQGKITKTSSSRKVHPEHKTEDATTSIMPETKGFSQKDAINERQKLLQQPNKVSASSIHLQQFTAPSRVGFSPIDASEISYHEHVNNISQAPTLNDRQSVNHSPETKLPMLSMPPAANFTTCTAPYTTPRLYRSAMKLNGMSTTPVRKPPATLPVSGYDYDFSALTQGMFAKQ